MMSMDIRDDQLDRAIMRSIADLLWAWVEHYQTGSEPPRLTTSARYANWYRERRELDNLGMEYD